MKKTYLFLAALLLASFLAAPLSAQTEKLGDISYTPPKGWTKTAKEHAVVFSSLGEVEQLRFRKWRKASVSFGGRAC